MTVLTLALLAGSQPAAPRLAPVHQIGPQSRRQSPHTPCAPLVRTDALTLTWQKADRHKRSAPTSSSHTPWPNPHSACGTAAAPLPAISCLGAFRPPAARARGEVRHCRQPKTCTGTDIPRVSLRRGAKKHRIDIWFHTALMPANLITPAHFSVSSAINLLKSAGEPRNAVLPRSHVGVAEGGVDLPVELVDDLDGRISGCADAVPGCVGRARSCRARSGAPHLPAPAERPRPRPHPPLGSRETPP